MPHHNYPEKVLIHIFHLQNFSGIWIHKNDIIIIKIMIKDHLSRFLFGAIQYAVQRFSRKQMSSSFFQNRRRKKFLLLWLNIPERLQRFYFPFKSKNTTSDPEEYNNYPGSYAQPQMRYSYDFFKGHKSVSCFMLGSDL